ncbi:hypothetical protein [Comamonas faecalis]|uniref:hypothetical protein n=1 Tax=Comamonas faecalis TaxID=1387849 RepID=UPI0031ECC9AA
MKAMDSRPGQGANRSDSHSYREDLQRRHGCEDTLSCFDISRLLYWYRYGCPETIEARRCARTPVTTPPVLATVTAIAAFCALPCA